MKGPTKLQRQAVQAIVEKWRPRLYLNEWHIDVEHMKSEAERNPGSVGAGETLAEVHACPVYLQASVQVYPEFWEKPAWQQEKVIVHELSHCLTQELFNAIRSLWNDESVSQRDARERLERLTQRITHIALYQQGCA